LVPGYNNNEERLQQCLEILQSTRGRIATSAESIRRAQLRIRGSQEKFLKSFTLLGRNRADGRPPAEPHPERP
jgi:hypothetical protein